MKQLFKIISIVFLIFATTHCFAQSQLKFANFQNFKTTSGEVIKELKVGYRTIGTLNADKSNAVLWPSWFTGTSQQLIDFGAVEKTLETKGIYLILVDALGNGVSSSPSNTKKFPAISIKDMVNSQYELLVKHLGIKKLKAVVGISMGAMQTYEWLVSYSTFMKKAVTMVGTPKQSFFDKLNWSTQAKLLQAAKNEDELNFAKNRVMDISTMNLYTPEYLAKNVKIEDSETYMKDVYSKMNNHKDYIAQIGAMIDHDIYKSSNATVKTIDKNIKAELLIIVNRQDHTVNPLSSIELAKNVKSKLVVLDSISGHVVNFEESDVIKKEVNAFLED